MHKDFNVICAVGCSFFHSATEGEELSRTNYAPEHAKHYKKLLLFYLIEEQLMYLNHNLFVLANHYCLKTFEVLLQMKYLCLTYILSKVHIHKY